MKFNAHKNRFTFAILSERPCSVEPASRGQGLLKHLRFYENVFGLLKLGSWPVQHDLLLRRQHPTCAPNLANILLQQVAQLERIVWQLVSEDEGGTTHGELEPEHLSRKLFLARNRLQGLLRLKL